MEQISEKTYWNDYTNVYAHHRRYMKKVMAQGVFDILHPGHIHYLSKSAQLGDELHVVIARDSRVRNKKDIFMGEDERKQVVESIEVVDSVILGSEGDLFDSVQKIKPNVITIGHDQSFDIESLEEQLEERGFPGIEVIRINRYERNGLQSSSEIKKNIQDKIGGEIFFSKKE